MYHTFEAAISDDRVGQFGAYIYWIFASNLDGEGAGVCYVGQTRSRLGATQRLATHISTGSGATFRRAVARVFGIEPGDFLGTIRFAACRLPDRTEYLADATDYREAIEDLVHHSLREFVINEPWPVTFVATTRTNPYARTPFVRDDAKNVYSNLISVLQAVIVSEQG